MKRYFLSQLKCLARYLPGVLAVIVLLALVLGLSVAAMAQNPTRQTVCIGIVGTAEDTMMQTVLSALSGLDSTRFSVTLASMEEAEARQGLLQGDLEAYVKFSEGFLDAIMYGHVKPIEYVSLGGAPELAGMVTEELTAVLTRILTDAQKGIYGAGAAMQAHGQGSQANQMIYDISIAFAMQVLNRDQVYQVQTLPGGGRPELSRYLLLGLTVTGCFLLTLPFAPVLLHWDNALERMLAAKGYGAFVQVLCQLTAYGCVLLLCVLLPVLVLSFWGVFPQSISYLRGLWTMLPVVLLAAAQSLFLYEMTRQLLSGMVLNFLVSLFGCFLGGCLYPVWFFPQSLQRLAAWLPGGMARLWLAGMAAGEGQSGYLAGILGYCLLLFLAAVALRRGKLRRGAV